MRATPNLAVERYRLKDGLLASSRFDGNNGAFRVPLPGGESAAVMVSDGMGWDHVSVSLAHRCPTWEEMCHVRDLFFAPEECVVEFHPPRSQYVNDHPFCLHLWRPQGVDLPMPSPIMVGVGRKGPRSQVSARTSVAR